VTRRRPAPPGHSAEYLAERQQIVDLGRLLAELDARPVSERRARKDKLLEVAERATLLTKQLHELADEMELGPQWSALEDAFRRFGRPDRQLPWIVAHNAQESLEELSGAAKSAAEKEAHMQTRSGPGMVALLFVQLRHDHGLSRPKLTLDGPDVEELSELLKAAGMATSEENARRVLQDVLRDFDRLASRVARLK
jgi:hypothetical protein